MGQIEDALEASRVLTIDEISTLAQNGGKPAETLTNVCALIARRFRVDVCCVYLLEPDRKQPGAGGKLGPSPSNASAHFAWARMKVWWGWWRSSFAPYGGTS